MSNLLSVLRLLVIVIVLLGGTVAGVFGLASSTWLLYESTGSHELWVATILIGLVVTGLILTGLVWLVDKALPE